MPRRPRTYAALPERRAQRDELIAERAAGAPLPHSLDAEMSVLGSLLVHGGGWDTVVSVLRPQDFYRDAHQRLFRVIGELCERGVPVDLVTLQEELRRTDEVDAVGGPSYISSLMDGVPRSTNLAYYAGIVRDKSIRRELIEAANLVLNEAYAGELTTAELVAKADGMITAVSAQRSGEMVTPHDAALRAMALIEERITHKGGLIGVDTGFGNINEYTMGWRPGNLILVAARPSMGKTTFALNTALAAARLGKTVAVFSLEMTVEELEMRLIAMMSGVMHFKIEKGWMSEKEQQLVGRAATERANLKIFIDEHADITPSEVRAKARQLRATDGLDLIVVDYLQLCHGGKQYGNRQEEVADISRRFKGVAKELHTPLIALSQLSRASEGRKDPRPQLHDLRESGSLEQDADVVAFIHCDDHKISGLREFILEKMRNGPTGVLDLHFEREILQFREIAPPVGR